jgi:hypothetical protein
MTQHLRPGRDARKRRQESAKARQKQYASLSPEQRVMHDADAKGAYDYTHGGPGAIPPYRYLVQLRGELSRA